MIIKPSGKTLGAAITEIDLSRPLSNEAISLIRDAWLEYHVIFFPEQVLDHDQLLKFSLALGPFGDDPFIEPIEGRRNIIAIQRKSTEKSPLFAENWHTDWSFQAKPPAGTCLYGIDIPPVGGDTLFADQIYALSEMPKDLFHQIEGRFAVHSAKLAYAPDGMYGDSDRSSGRSMLIKSSQSAYETQIHPLVKTHPETGRPSLFGCLGYIIGIEGMTNSDAFELLSELITWQTKPEFVYRHRWSPNMLVLWDNRCLLHCATGGYEGYSRYLLRTTVADDVKSYNA